MIRRNKWDKLMVTSTGSEIPQRFFIVFSSSLSYFYIVNYSITKYLFILYLYSTNQI